jgi:hypothetical protein
MREPHPGGSMREPHPGPDEEPVLRVPRQIGRLRTRFGR